MDNASEKFCPYIYAIRKEENGGIKTSLFLKYRENGRGVKVLFGSGSRKYANIHMGRVYAKTINLYFNEWLFAPSHFNRLKMELRADGAYHQVDKYVLLDKVYYLVEPDGLSRTKE